MFLLKAKTLPAVFIALIATSHYTWASEFKKTKSCGEAKVEGDTCSKVKVHFTFENCPIQFEPVTINKVICEGHNIIARATRANYRFEAQYKKKDDGWGGVTWQPVHPIKVWTKSEFAADKSHAQNMENNNKEFEPQREAASEGNQQTVLLTVPKGLKFSGFFDVRKDWYNSQKAGANNDQNSGFLFDDGAFYLDYDNQPLSVHLDLPISRDTEDPNSARIKVGEKKAQYYMKYNFSENFNLVYGQFDTLFGVELNDSKDRVFSHEGLVYSQTLPVVHTGAYLHYDFKPFNVKLLVANPADRGTLGSDSTDSSTEYGLTFGFSSDSFRGQLGHLTRKVYNLKDKEAQRSLTDVVLGMTYASFNIDFQYSLVDSPRKNTLTSNPTDSEDSGSGFLALASYDFSKKFRAGFRYELLIDDPGAEGFKDAETYSVDLTYNLHEKLAIHLESKRIDVREKSISAGANAYDNEIYSFGAIAKF